MLLITITALFDLIKKYTFLRQNAMKNQMYQEQILPFTVYHKKSVNYFFIWIIYKLIFSY